jgi:hypothetical protein
MSGRKLFLDTNIILYLLNGDETLAELLNMKQLYVSVITEIELLGFNGINTEDEKIIKEFISQCKVININEKIKDETIRLRKKYHTKIPDCLIIATALYLDLPLISSDSGFKKVEELFLIQYEK